MANPFDFEDALKALQSGKPLSVTVLGLKLDGTKEVLGLYLSETEGANFWLSVLTDINNRGVQDILIASVDGLAGFPDSINTLYPITEVQLCIIHQIRNSMKYVASKCYQQCKTDPLPQLKSDPVVSHWYLFKRWHDFKRRTHENTNFASTRIFAKSDS